MLPLSQTTGYAVRALQCLQEPGGHPVLVEEVADCTGIPRSYLSKLVHKLAKKGGKRNRQARADRMVEGKQIAMIRYALQPSP